MLLLLLLMQLQLRKLVLLRQAQLCELLLLELGLLLGLQNHAILLLQQLLLLIQDGARSHDRSRGGDGGGHHVYAGTRGSPGRSVGGGGQICVHPRGRDAGGRVRGGSGGPPGRVLGSGARVTWGGGAGRVGAGRGDPGALGFALAAPFLRHLPWLRRDGGGGRRAGG